MTNEKQIWKAVNNLVDFYKSEMEKYKDLYYKEKEKYELLHFHVSRQDFDEFEYRGYKLKDLYEFKINHIDI